MSALQKKLVDCGVSTDRAPTRIDFLDTVLAQGGSYCVVGLTSGKPRTHFFDTIKEIEDWADLQPAGGTDAYFSPATYEDTSLGRNVKNTKLFRSLYVDLDIGKGTEFDTQADGLAALRIFINSLSLPEPTIVSSGYGMHCYWTFDEAVDYNTWKPLANALKDRLSTENFRIKDKGITADAVRILRIPNTKNFKGGTQVDVEVLVLSPSSPIQSFESLIIATVNLSPISASLPNSKKENIFLEQELLKVCVNMLKKAEKEGSRHDARLKVGMLSGGCIAAGWAREDIVIPAIRQASDSVAEGALTNASELKTIKDGVIAGREKPISEEEFKTHLGLGGAVFRGAVGVSSFSSAVGTVNSIEPCSRFSLKNFSMQGQAEVMRKQMLDDVFVLALIAILGQATTIYARANTGKTLLVLWMLIQSIIEKRIKGENVIYVNADDTFAGFIQKLELAEKYGFHMLMPNQNGFEAQAMQGYLRQMIDDDTARNSIVVLDTLKKFADLMDKKAVSGFMSRVREFIAAGGTVISLAHTNKNKNGEGKSVFCGTSDVVDDCDCVYILDTVSTTDSLKVVLFENIKNRGSVAKELAVSYSVAQGVTYQQRFDSVKIGSETEALKAKVEIAVNAELNHDKKAIQAITEALEAEQGSCTKTDLLKFAQGLSDVSRRFLQKTLEKYTGSLWSESTGDKNTHSYQLIKKKELLSMEGLLADWD